VKTRSFVYVLTLLLTLGLIAFSVHAESENLIDADPKPTNDVESVETESADEAPDTETVAEALKKVEQILNVLQGSFEDISQLTKVEGITNDEVTNKVNQIVNNLKNIEGVEITTSFEEKELDLSEILKNPNDLQDFEKKVKVISANDNLDENAKKQKIFELIENLELDSTIFPDITKFKDVESQTMEPTEFFNAARDILGVIGKANELHKQGDLDKDQLAEKMREMLKDLNVKPTVISDSDSDNISIVLSAGSCIHCTNNKGISDRKSVV